MGYDPGLVARVADALEQLGERGIRQKTIFGGRGFLRGKRALVIVWDDRLLMKGIHGVPFVIPGKGQSRSWVSVPAEAIADDAQLREWLRRVCG